MNRYGVEPAPRIWGPGVFDNDIGVKARDLYLSFLVEGRTGADACRLTTEMRGRDANDTDFRLLFWTALAETQRLVGHLEQGVIDSLIYFLEMGDGPTMRSRRDLYPARDEVLDDHRRQITIGALGFPMNRDDVLSFVRKTWGEKVAARLE